MLTEHVVDVGIPLQWRLIRGDVDVLRIQVLLGERPLLRKLSLSQLSVGVPLRWPVPLLHPCLTG